jgi:alkylhydroperoxidase/carboxymuconolactone decarboxylase family protein YurZ
MASPTLENLRQTLSNIRRRRNRLYALHHVSLAVIAVTLAGYQSDQLRTHLLRGLDNGLSVQEIAELIAQVTLYSGFPSGINASRIFGDVLRERGLDMPETGAL